MNDDRHLKELIDTFSRTEDLLSYSDDHSLEAAALKKAWIRYIFSSLSKLNDGVEAIKSDFNVHEHKSIKEAAELKLELSSTRSDFKEAINVFKEEFRRDEIKPLQNKYDTLMLKVIKIGAASSFITTLVIGIFLKLFKII
jgi:hypothetical protein